MRQAEATSRTRLGAQSLSGRASGTVALRRYCMGSSKHQSGDTMRNDQVTAFPAIHLAQNSEADTPAELCCRKLTELSDRLDQFHAFKG
jgi:hypothetical protein